jgi:hypothetical protein
MRRHALTVLAAALLSVLAVLGASAPAAAEPQTVERCLADLELQLFDESETAQIDAISLVQTPASHTFKRGHSRRSGEFAVPPAGGLARSVDVVGSTTGDPYRFSLDWRMSDVTTGNGTTRGRATITVRLTTPEGRLVSEVVSRSVVVFDGGQVETRFSGHDRGLPLHAQFSISCDPVPRNPTEVFGLGEPITYEIVAPADGPFSATPRGLIPWTGTSGTVAQDPGQTFTRGGPGTTALDFTIPDGTTHARFALRFDEVTGANDLDLYLYRGDDLVASGTSPAPVEQLDVPDPAPGSYRLWVHGYDVRESEAAFVIRHWFLGTDPTGTMSVRAPTFLTAGVPEYVTLTFTGLAPATLYLGSVAYEGVDGLPESILVNVVSP